jgi:hypothetical protein
VPDSGWVALASSRFPLYCQVLGPQRAAISMITVVNCLAVEEWPPPTTPA